MTPHTQIGTRRCSACKVEKSFSEFYKEHTRKYGISYRCKVCSSKKTNKRLPKNKKKNSPELVTCHCGNQFIKLSTVHKCCSTNCTKALGYYRHREKKLALARIYHKRTFTTAKANENTKKRLETSPEKVAARLGVYNAVLRGDIKKLPCEVCGELKVHAHHHLGYEGENAFKVQWLCITHHYEKHRRKYSHLKPPTEENLLTND